MNIISHFSLKFQTIDETKEEFIERNQGDATRRRWIDGGLQSDSQSGRKTQWAKKKQKHCTGWSSGKEEFR